MRELQDYDGPLEGVVVGCTTELLAPPSPTDTHCTSHERCCGARGSDKLVYKLLSVCVRGEVILSQ